VEVVDWIHLAHSRVQWQAVVNMVKNLHILYKAGNFLTSRRTVLRGGLDWVHLAQDRV